MKLSLHLLALAGCYVLFFEQLFLSYGSLPAHLATHFDIAGRPNGWMSRDGFVELMVALGILAPGFIVATMTATGWVPVSFVKLPNRDYWLAPERRRASSAILLRFGIVLAGMMVLFFESLNVLVVQANSAGGGQHLNGAGMAVISAAFLAGIVWWAIALHRRFAYRP